MWKGLRPQAALLLALVTIAGCTNTHTAATRRSPSPTAVSSASATSTPAVLRLRATKSFSYPTGPRQSVHVAAARLVVSKGMNGGFDQEVTLLFPRPTFGAICVVEAQLTLKDPSVHDGPADLGVFPSAAFGFSTGQTPEEPDLLLDNRPAGHATATAASRSVEVDVTSLVRTWLQGTFPSLGKRVPHSLPVLLTVQPPDGMPGRYSVSFAGVVTSQPPVLVIGHRC